jgi:hypothetical protein
MRPGPRARVVLVGLLKVNMAMIASPAELLGAPSEAADLRDRALEERDTTERTTSGSCWSDRAVDGTVANSAVTWRRSSAPTRVTRAWPQFAQNRASSALGRPQLGQGVMRFECTARGPESDTDRLPGQLCRALAK